MAHSARTGSTGPSRPRRGRAELIVGIVAVVLGLAIAGFAVVGLTKPEGQRNTNRKSSVAQSTEAPGPSTSASAAPTPTPSPTPTPTPTPSPTTAAAARVPLVVLNNTSTAGLAATAAQRFQAGGWTVTSTSNYSNDIISTAAYYDPADPANQAAAQALQAQFPAIKRVVPKFSGLPAGPIVVVLTTDYS